MNRFSYKGITDISSDINLETQFLSTFGKIQNVFADNYQANCPDIEAEDYLASAEITYDITPKNLLKLGVRLFLVAHGEHLANFRDSAMRNTYILLLLVFGKAWGAELPVLEVSNIYSIDWPTRMDISGLTYCNGSLLAVADNIDEAIFKIDINKDSAKISPFLSLGVISKPIVDYEFFHSIEYTVSKLIFGYRYDWEGIACTEHEVLLASESEASILIFSRSGQHLDSIELYPDARKSGYFNDYNAFIEGVTYYNDTIFGAVERGPRGVLRINNNAKARTHASFRNLPNDKELEYIKSSIDVSGLEVFNGYLYTLERGASAICKRDFERYRSISCYSYKQVEHAVDTSYLSTEFGIGEGIAVIDSKIYVAFDNNGEGRKINPDDTRPLLIEFARPPDF